MADKIFCGSGREIGQYGQLAIILDADVVAKHVTNWEDKDGTNHRQIKVKVSKRKEPKGKQTHYVEIDTFVPTPQGQQATPPQGDLPF